MVSKLYEEFLGQLNALEQFDIKGEVMLKLNGVILRKAEMENNFEKVYTRVFEQMARMQFLGFTDVVEVLGETGG